MDDVQKVYVVRKAFEIFETFSNEDNAIIAIQRDMKKDNSASNGIPQSIIQKNPLNNIGDTLSWKNYTIVVDDYHKTLNGEYTPVQDSMKRPWWRDWDASDLCCISEMATDEDSPAACCAVVNAMDSGGECCASSASFDGASCYVATSSLDINPEDFRQTEIYKNHPDLVALRKYRDTILAKSICGRIFAKAYYLFGRYPARFISDKPKLKWFTRICIVKPSAKFARWICK